MPANENNKAPKRLSRVVAEARLRELTGHHRDHNHDNNPPDGSNWELLCIYCHDNEHGRLEVAEAYAADAAGRETSESDFSHKPFAALEALLKKNNTDDDGSAAS